MIASHFPCLLFTIAPRSTEVWFWRPLYTSCLPTTRLHSRWTPASKGTALLGDIENCINVTTGTGSRSTSSWGRCRSARLGALPGQTLRSHVLSGRTSGSSRRRMAVRSWTSQRMSLTTPVHSPAAFDSSDPPTSGSSKGVLGLATLLTMAEEESAVSLAPPT